MLSEEEFIKLTSSSPSLTKSLFIGYTPRSLADVFMSIHEYLEMKLNSMDDFTILKDLTQRESGSFTNVFDQLWCKHSHILNKGMMFFVSKKIKQGVIKDWIIEESMYMLEFIAEKKYLDISNFDKILITYNYSLSLSEKAQTPYLSGFLKCKPMSLADHQRIVMYTQVIMKNIDCIDEMIKKLESTVNSPDFGFIVDQFITEHNSIGSRLFYPKTFSKNWSDKVSFVWTRINNYIKKDHGK